MGQTEAAPAGIPERVRAWQARVESALAAWLPAPDTHPGRLHEAMRYGVLGGGKRLRPMLMYAAGEALGVPAERLDGPAAAVELIHAYSLIHDDLPAMDDDDLRRGRPTCHRVFGEAMAILAGDAMQALSFYILAHDPAMAVGPAQRVEMIAELARACGSRGMAGGQAIDLESVGRSLDIAALEDMHVHKTGALILASIRLALSAARPVPGATEGALNQYGKRIGLAFQIQDDILDVEGETAVLGKTRGADAALDKPTYPALLGLEEARQRALELSEQAIAALSPLGERATILAWLARYVVQREY